MSANAFLTAETLLDFGAHFGGEVFVEIEVEFQNVNPRLPEKSKLSGFGVLRYQRP
jgi:hypothetical protein